MVGHRQTEFAGEPHPATTDRNSDGIEQSIHHLKVAGHRCRTDDGGFAGSPPEGGSSLGHLVAIAQDGGIGERHQLGSRW